jgi:hypothetical protein
MTQVTLIKNLAPSLNGALLGAHLAPACSGAALAGGYLAAIIQRKSMHHMSKSILVYSTTFSVAIQTILANDSFSLKNLELKYFLQIWMASGLNRNVFLINIGY